MTKQTLTEAVELVRTNRGLHNVTRCGLGGCPVGGWAETQQAIRRITEELPMPNERSYTTHELIDALYEVDSAGRYQYRADSSGIGTNFVANAYAGPWARKSRD